MADIKSNVTVPVSNPNSPSTSGAPMNDMSKTKMRVLAKINMNDQVKTTGRVESSKRPSI